MGNTPAWLEVRFQPEPAALAWVNTIFPQNWNPPIPKDLLYLPSISCQQPAERQGSERAPRQQPLRSWQCSHKTPLSPLHFLVHSFICLHFLA